uniref:Uncharacterized protein n=1 Tax=Accipiter nisus TaxID=211598 RepID=A0A8B9NM91_9AVES
MSAREPNGRPLSARVPGWLLGAHCVRRLPLGAKTPTGCLSSERMVVGCKSAHWMPIRYQGGCWVPIKYQGSLWAPTGCSSAPWVPVGCHSSHWALIGCKGHPGTRLAPDHASVCLVFYSPPTHPPFVPTPCPSVCLSTPPRSDETSI